MRFLPRSMCASMCALSCVVTLLMTGCASGDEDPVTAPGDANIASPSPTPSTAPSTSSTSSTTTSTTPTTPSTTAGLIGGAASTTTVSPVDDLAPPGTPSGFESVAATITLVSGEVCELCLWVADDPALRSRGLMDVTDLGAADGMLFAYDTPTSTAFWMKDTPLPLSIAFFDGRGTYLDSFDMEPCAVEPCERYPTPLDFVDAIEFPMGTVDELGVGPGSVLDVTDLPCEP